ncbi:MAG: DUF6702 family protein [Cytophagaceae bacterium]
MRKTTGIFILLCLPVFSMNSHPLKMAYTAIKYLPEKQVFEISHRVFQDDFELTLTEKYNYSGADVVENQNDSYTRKVVDAFFDKNFSMHFNNVRTGLKHVKTEQKQQMGIVITYETENINTLNLKDVKIYNFILMESFKEQLNMLSLNINDEVKRTLKFDIKNTKKSIDLK